MVGLGDALDLGVRDEEGPLVSNGITGRSECLSQRPETQTLGMLQVWSGERMRRLGELGSSCQ